MTKLGESSRDNGSGADGRLHARPQPSGAMPDVERGARPLGLESRRDGLLYVPQTYGAGRPAPLLLLLHGAGASGRDVLPWFTPFADGKGLLVLAPDSRSSSWDVIRGGYGPDVGFIDRALDHVFSRHDVDAGRIAVGGFSDGASYALSLGLMNGGLFSDILAFSPGFMAPTLIEGAPRIFISHGIHDTVLPIERCGRKLARTLKEAGYDVDYREFDGGHTVPLDVIVPAIERFLS